MTQCRDESDIRVLRMDGNAADRARVAQASERPGFARVDGFVHAVSVNDVAANAGLTCAGIDHVGIGRRYGDCSDRWRHVFHLVGHGTPGQSAIRALPHAAAYATEIICVRIADDAAHGQNSSATEGANQSPGEAMPRTFWFVLFVVGRRFSFRLTRFPFTRSPFTPSLLRCGWLGWLSLCFWRIWFFASLSEATNSQEHHHEKQETVFTEQRSTRHFKPPGKAFFRNRTS